MCFSSVWTQSPYNDINSLHFLSPENLNNLNYQAILSLEWITSALSTLNTMIEVRSLSKALNPQLLSGRRSIGCPLLQVCVVGLQIVFKCLI